MHNWTIPFHWIDVFVVPVLEYEERESRKPREGLTGLTLVCTLKVIVAVDANVALGLQIEDGVLYTPE
jgi:hypothetical protein